MSLKYTVLISYFRSPEWNKVSDSQKKDLGLTFDDNGEFWCVFYCLVGNVLKTC